MARSELETNETESSARRSTDSHASKGIGGQDGDTTVLPSGAVPLYRETARRPRIGGCLDHFFLARLMSIVTFAQPAVDDIIERMDEYYLSREDWDTIVELGVDQNKDELVLKKISTSTKTSFTKK